ncbi:MAG: hypothetical protein R3246_09080 [Acidimicrobiia bacterium]|nr:hypothetical protein [Acidimicrobiia bacterium]
MTRSRLVAAAFAGITAFAVGFYAALASVVAVSGIGGPIETRLEITAIALGTGLSVLAVAFASGRFSAVIGRVALAGVIAAVGAGLALALIESDPGAMIVAGLIIVGVEVAAIRGSE